MDENLACVILFGIAALAWVAVHFIRHKWPRSDTPAE